MAVNTISANQVQQMLARNQFSLIIDLRDYYDYASGDYNGMEGIAVNAMYLAQQSGAIVPYNVLISQRL